MLKAYNTGSILSLLGVIAFGVLWYLSKYQWGSGQETLFLSWAVIVGLFFLGLLAVRKLVYNKNDFDLLEEYGWGNVALFSLGGLFISTAVLAGCAFAVSQIFMMFFNVGAGVFI